jgi:hypothetical protein
MLLSSSKPFMIATCGMPGIPLNRESESVEDVHRVLRALPLFREMEGILRERNLNLFFTLQEEALARLPVV